MGLSFGGRLKHAWNAFVKQDPWGTVGAYGDSYGVRLYTTRGNLFGEKSIVGSIYNKIAIDVAITEMLHVRLDENGRYTETIKSGLNNCLTVEANVDQGAFALRLDQALTLLEKGVIAIVPVDTTLDPNSSGAWDIQTMRVGEIVQWFPRHVRVDLYNDQTGRREQVTLPKKDVAIVENPHYTIMNEPNSTLQRLIRKLSLLDAVDEQTSSGKHDIMIQLPYVIKSEARRQQAEQRRKDIEMQLKGSQYGIAYVDGTERITQLNRPAENNLLTQVEYLTEMLYAQLGLTKSVFDGTADEKTMLNYYNRTINPILKAISEGMVRAFLTTTARSQGQSIKYYRDPFELVSVSEMADIADKFTRNAIASPNDIRTGIGWKPIPEKDADKAINRNMPVSETPGPEAPTPAP